MEELHTSGLTSEGVNANEAELQHFRALHEWDAAQELISPMQVGYTVRIVSGTFKGGWGVITEIKEASVCLCWENNEEDIREILTRDIRKSFHLGDLVQVLYGPRRGDHGFVVHVNAEEVVLYKHHPTLRAVAGSEVSSCFL